VGKVSVRFFLYGNLVRTEKKVKKMTDDKFGSNLGYVLSLIGMAVGLGSVLKAPAAFYQYGGTFVIPFIVALFVMAIPVFLAETQLGVKTGRSFPMAMKSLKPRSELLGWYALAGGLVICAYYNVLIGYFLDYIYESFTLAWGSNPEAYFHNDVLRLSPDIMTIGGIAPKIAIAGTIMFVGSYLIIKKGIQAGLERANLILLPSLLVISVIFGIRAFMLPGAADGLRLLITPNWGALLTPAPWLAAFTLMCFLSSVGMGLATTFGAAIPKTTNIWRNTLIIVGGVACYAMFMASVSLSVIGYLAQTTGKSIGDVVAGGFSLAFVTYPMAINAMPWAQVAFGVAFFLVATAAGLSSSLSFYAAFPSAMKDKLGWTSLKGSRVAVASTGFASILFMTGAGLMWCDIIDMWTCTYIMLATVVLELPYFIKYYGLDQMRADILENTGVRIGRWFNCCIYLSMVAVGGLIANGVYSSLVVPYGGYPIVAQVLSVAYVMVFILAGYYIYRMKPL
jgi:NSS family neurotransmitter:Na+ symporter